jgi:hypothetical protein
MAGFVGVFQEPFERSHVEAFVSRWLHAFERVEQVVPGPGVGCTVELYGAEDILWEQHMQFRILDGESAAWVYLSLDRRCVEVTAWQTAGSLQLSLDLLVELPGLTEVVPESDQERIDQLVKEGAL